MQLIKGKPRGKGLKYYALCDPKSGFAYAAMLHSKTRVPHEESWGRILAICYALLSGDDEHGLVSYLDQGYYVSSCLFFGLTLFVAFIAQVFTDRFYTGTHMNYAMATRSTFFCGTLRREQRSNLPAEIMLGTRRVPTPQIVKNLSRGDILTRYSSYGAGPVLVHVV